MLWMNFKSIKSSERSLDLKVIGIRFLFIEYFRKSKIIVIN